MKMTAGYVESNNPTVGKKSLKKPRNSFLEEAFSTSLILEKKETKKEEKSKLINTFLSHCIKVIRPHDVVKNEVLKCLKFCNKYGNETQRNRILELFEIHIEIMIPCPNIKWFLKSLFQYGNFKRRMALLNLLGSQRIPKLLMRNDLYMMFNKVFVNFLDPRLRYHLILLMFGKHYELYKASSSKQDFQNFIKHDSFSGAMIELLSHVESYLSKEHLYDLEIFHFLFLKLQESIPAIFNEKIAVPLFNETCVISFLKTHYGCELVARLFFYARFNKNDQLLKLIEQVIFTESTLSILKFSGRLHLIYAIMNFPEYNERMLEIFWKPFLNDISFYIGNGDGERQYWIKLLEILPLTIEDTPKRNELLIKFFQDTKDYQDIKMNEKIEIIPRNDNVNQHLEYVKAGMIDHFLKNLEMIFFEANYGFAFAKWLYLIPKDILTKIYDSLCSIMNYYKSELDVDSFLNKTTLMVINKIFFIQNECFKKGYLDVNLANMLIEKIGNEKLTSWKDDEIGKELYKSIYKNVSK